MGGSGAVAAGWGPLGACCIRTCRALAVAPPPRVRAALRYAHRRRARAHVRSQSRGASRLHTPFALRAISCTSGSPPRAARQCSSCTEAAVGAHTLTTCAPRAASQRAPSGSSARARAHVCLGRALGPQALAAPWPAAAPWPPPVAAAPAKRGQGLNPQPHPPPPPHPSRTRRRGPPPAARRSRRARARPRRSPTPRPGRAAARAPGAARAVCCVCVWRAGGGATGLWRRRLHA